jgi:hypothetical protein
MRTWRSNITITFLVPITDYDFTYPSQRDVDFFTILLDSHEAFL